MNELLTPQEVLQVLIDGQDGEFKGKNSDKWCEFCEYLTDNYLHQLSKLAQNSKE